MSNYNTEMIESFKNKKIEKAEVYSFGMKLFFDDGTQFYFDASDGGYSLFFCWEDESDEHLYQNDSENG